MSRGEDNECVGLVGERCGGVVMGCRGMSESRGLTNDYDE